MKEQLERQAEIESSQPKFKASQDGELEVTPTETSKRQDWVAKVSEASKSLTAGQEIYKASPPPAEPEPKNLVPKYTNKPRSEEIGNVASGNNTYDVHTYEREDFTASERSATENL